MSIEAFQIATAVLGASTTGIAVISYGLRKRLKDANERLKDSAWHVRNLQRTLASTYDREEQLERQNVELSGMVKKVHDQRVAASKSAAAKRAAAKAGKEAGKAAATAKTFAALQAAPLRPRDEVVANIRSSKAAQAVSSGG